jgi:cysteinyl-tRNA synthetase
VLGLNLRYEPKSLDEIPLRPLIELAVRYEVDPKDAKATESIIKLLLNKRAALRTARKWQLADSIRNDLKEIGITLEDTSEGTISRYKKP